MTSSIRSNAYRWLATVFALALVLGLLVGSNQNTAQAIDPGETDIAYVADGYNFPDALMGATLAGLNTAPMLGVRSPTTGDLVPPETAAELDRLTNNKASKLDTIYVFGGPAAVSDKVVGELGAWADNVERIFGADRFGTMAEISEALPSKARDSDLLDGMDSTDFLGATDQATDSDLLDGMDSTDFLGATEQAVDSDQLDGKDSTAFVETANNVAEYKRNGAFVAVGSTPTTILSLNVPAGSYVVMAKGLMNNNDANVVSMSCEISGPSITDDLSAVSLDVEAEADRIPFSLIVPATFGSPGTVDLVCETTASSANLGDSAMTAIPVSSYNAQ